MNQNYNQSEPPRRPSKHERASKPPSPHVRELLGRYNHELDGSIQDLTALIDARRRLTRQDDAYYGVSTVDQYGRVVYAPDPAIAGSQGETSDLQQAPMESGPGLEDFRRQVGQQVVSGQAERAA